jgi:hypothetical protein
MIVLASVSLLVIVSTSQFLFAGAHVMAALGVGLLLGGAPALPFIGGASVACVLYGTKVGAAGD